MHDAGSNRPGVNCRTTRAYPEVNSSADVYRYPVGKPGPRPHMQAPSLDRGSRRAVRRLGGRAIRRNGRSLLDLAVEKVSDAAEDQAVHHQGDGECGEL
jgi:hypothetical protein